MRPPRSGSQGTYPRAVLLQLIFLHLPFSGPKLLTALAFYLAVAAIYTRRSLPHPTLPKLCRLVLHDGLGIFLIVSITFLAQAGTCWLSYCPKSRSLSPCTSACMHLDGRYHHRHISPPRTYDRYYR